jgi:hypothetical protein
VQQLIYLLEYLALPSTNGNFSATWTLRDPNGRQVLQARYQVKIDRRSD